MNLFMNISIVFGNTQGGSATPANPYTNIIGSELGYFSAHTSEMKEKVIQ
jgi:hypothetical protein